MNIAVVIATYNRPDALAALLEGYLRQDTGDFELIVADDGSDDPVRQLVEQYGSRGLFRISHIWHKNEGYRATVMRNRAIAMTRADYVICTDADCVPSKDFIRRHRKLAEQGCFLSGSRVLLSESFTNRVLTEKLPVHDWGFSDWLGARLRGEINRITPLLRLPDGNFRKYAPKRWKGAKTCNLSAWRKDLIAVNGFDESYAGRWGREDSDLVIRLIHAGIMHKSARFAASVLHLWHRESDKSGFNENQKLLDDLIDSGRIKARLGLDQYL